jgi:hypothetical protein
VDRKNLVARMTERLPAILADIEEVVRPPAVAAR